MNLLQTVQNLSYSDAKQRNLCKSNPLFDSQRLVDFKIINENVENAEDYLVCEFRKKRISSSDLIGTLVVHSSIRGFCFAQVL